MLNGAFALLERSLRIDARGWSTHLVRLALMSSIYFALCYSLTTQSFFGAPGLRFFRGIAYLDVAFMTLLGLGFFSTAITEEKEEDTLGLMLMAGISPLAILAGKSGGRLWQAVLLVVVQYPFLLLSVTMGGVSSAQIQAVSIALLAYMIFLAGIGLLCSTIAPRNRTATSLMSIGLITYVLVPWFAQMILWYYASWFPGMRSGAVMSQPWMSILEGVRDLCVLMKLSDILTTGFGESPFSLQVVSNTAVGLVCAGLSWLLFGLATRSPSTEAASRGLVARQRASFRFDASRPWRNPFVWKDFYFVSGGIGMMLVRTLFYGVPAMGLLIYHYLKDFPNRDDNTELFLLLMSFLVCVDAANLLARSLHDEIGGQTLTTLMMLPDSSNRIIYTKFTGALLGWIPGPILELVLTLNTVPGRRDLWFLFGNQQGIGWTVVLLFVLIPHFAAIAALFMRWGAVPLAIGMAFGVYFTIGMIGGWGWGPNQGYFVRFVVTFALLFLCVACQVAVLLRVQVLGVR